MWWARRPLHQMIFGGVFERFPTLDVAFTEMGADWIPSALQRFDAQYESPFERGIKEKLRKSPSEYWRSNCYVGASFLSRGECEIRDALGTDRIMWGADYPHIEGTWPSSDWALRDAFSGVAVDDVRKMVGETAARVYRFDLDLLKPLVAEIGPAVEDVVTPYQDPAVVYPEIEYALGQVSGQETGRRLMTTMLGRAQS
jgi:predicted TIM-barrel fold metal-dependent hydrolase